MRLSEKWVLGIYFKVKIETCTLAEAQGRREVKSFWGLNLKVFFF